MISPACHGPLSKNITKVMSNIVSGRLSCDVWSVIAEHCSFEIRLKSIEPLCSIAAEGVHVLGFPDMLLVCPDTPDAMIGRLSSKCQTHVARKNRTMNLNVNGDCGVFIPSYS
jgi:hypothetical protein